MIVCMFMFIICMATHLNSPPFSLFITQPHDFNYKIVSMGIFEEN
jgi:hypothetical protein